MDKCKMTSGSGSIIRKACHDSILKDLHLSVDQIETLNKLNDDLNDWADTTKLNIVMAALKNSGIT